MKLDEALDTLNKAGFIVENGQQMSRINLKKWLTSRFNVTFDEVGIGRIHAMKAIEIPDDEKLPILALDLDFINLPIGIDVSSLFLEEENEIELINFTVKSELKNITDFSKKDLSEYFSKLNKKILLLYNLKDLLYKSLENF